MLNISGLNKANYNDCVYWNNLSGNLTNVGENGSKSYIGTYDQSGNVSEWISENVYLGGNPDIHKESMIVIGGSYKSPKEALSSEFVGRYTLPIWQTDSYNTFTVNSDIGFRIAAKNPYDEHPANIPNIIPVSGKAWAQRYKYDTMWGLTTNGNVYLVNPSIGLSYTVGNDISNAIGASGYNAGAWDKSTNTTLFYANLGNSGLYSWNNQSDLNNMQLSGVYNWNNYINTDIYNAAYYSSGYWYFSQSTETLNKLLLAYDTGNGYVEATGQLSWTIDVPGYAENNVFGDIAVNIDSGILYSASINGNFYSINLLPTITGGEPYVLDSGNIHGDINNKLLQLSMGHNNTLYGHHYDSKTWYTIDTTNDFGNTSQIYNYDGSAFITEQFTDLLGSRKAGINFGPSSKVYGIAETPITNEQYAFYLNSVDPSGSRAEFSVKFNEINQYVIYNTGIIYSYMMGASDLGGISYYENNPTGNKYVVKRYMHNKPVNFVSFPMAAQYCNWLHNVTFDPNDSNTLDGAYNLDAPTLSSGTLNVFSGAMYYLPSREEWYMSAFYYENGSSYTTGNIPLEIINNISDNTMIIEDALGTYATAINTGYAILEDATWLTVDSVFNEDEITTIVFDKPLQASLYTSDYLTSQHITYYDIIPTGLYNYATQSNGTPECADIDQYGAGPVLLNQIYTLSLKDLCSGMPYRLTITIKSRDEYPAYLPEGTNDYQSRIIYFSPVSSEHDIAFSVKKYWSTLASVLQYELSINKNGSWINVESQNILIKCDNLDDNCIARMPLTPIPTITPSRSVDSTPTPTPSITLSRTPTRTPDPTPTSSPTLTPTITPTNTITPSVTPSNTVTPTVTPTHTITPTVTPSHTPTATPTPSEGHNIIITDDTIV